MTNIHFFMRSMMALFIVILFAFSILFTSGSAVLAGSVLVERYNPYSSSCNCTQMGLKVGSEKFFIGDSGLTRSILGSERSVAAWASDVSGKRAVFNLGGETDWGPDMINGTADDVTSGSNF